MVSVAKLIVRRRQRRVRQKRNQLVQRFLSATISTAVVVLGVLPAIVGGVTGWIYYQSLVAMLPAPQDTLALDPQMGTTRFYDRTGEVLIWELADPLGDEREWLSLAQIPPVVQAATLLQEDPNFLETSRFSWFELAQKLIYNSVFSPIGADPSLTGRLVRNAIAPQPATITAQYRAQETALVAEINRLYTPEQILEWHLNTNYYGNNAYGIAAAALVYFNKRVANLTTDEIAMLVAIPLAPQYNPIENEEAARGRQVNVLRDLQRAGILTQDDFSTYSTVVTPLQPSIGQSPLIAPDFALYAHQQAERLLSQQGLDGSKLVARGGLKIITSMDVELYRQVACTIESHLGKAQDPTCVGATYLPSPVAFGAFPPDQAVATLLDVRNGELLVGYGKFNTVNRVPAVTLLPFVYFKGFSTGLYTPATLLLDLPQRFPGAADGLIYSPQNADATFLGPVSLRQAMGNWLLPTAVQVANTEGLDSILRIARLIGVRGLDGQRYDLSLLEDGGQVSVLDTTYAYTVFAGLGEMRGVPTLSSEVDARRHDPVAVLRIDDANGTTLWAYDEARQQQSVTPILEPGLGYLVNHILSDRATRQDRYGLGNVFELSRPSAVVNGLNTARTDAWTVGYTPNLALGIWSGRTDGQPLTVDTLGTNASAPIWRAMMELAHDRYGLGGDDWQPPLNVLPYRVCERSGLVPNGVCPERTEQFLENTQPLEPDTYWKKVTINSQTRQLATANTPITLQQEQVFFIPPEEALEWWRANQLPLPPTDYDTITRPDLIRSTVILEPTVLAYVGGVVEVRGSLDGENLQYYQLAYGEGLNPTEWIAITEQESTYTPGRVLGRWDTTALNGLYNLRLLAVLKDNSVDPFIIQVTVDNTPPTLTLSAGENGQAFTFLGDRVIPLTVVAQDDIAIDRVEFFANDKFIGIDDTFPFGYDHPISRVASETFKAVVFDAAGNVAEAELQVEVTRGGT